MAKKIIKKYRNSSRKRPYTRSNKEMQEEVVSLKQVPAHPKDWLARKTKDEVKFVKQVPLHPMERFISKRKSIVENYS